MLDGTKLSIPIYVLIYNKIYMPFIFHLIHISLTRDEVKQKKNKIKYGSGKKFIISSSSTRTKRPLYYSPR